MAVPNKTPVKDTLVEKDCHSTDPIMLEQDFQGNRSLTGSESSSFEVLDGDGDGDDDGDNTLYSDIDTTNSQETTATAANDITKESMKSYFLPTLRFFSFWILLGIMVFVGVQIGRYSSEREEDQLEGEFHEVASHILQAAQARHQAILDALQTMSLTTLVLSSGQTWPFVTLEGFDLWTNRFAIGASAINLVVLTGEDERGDWADYSQANANAWIENQEALAAVTPYEWQPSADYSEKAAISWQSTPVNASAVNRNQLADPRFMSAFQRLRASLLPVEWADARSPGMTYFLQPILAPIGAEEELVGYLFAHIALTAYFSGADNLLDAKISPGVGVFIDNTCERHAVVLDLHHGRGAKLLPEGKIPDHELASEAPLYQPSTNQDEYNYCGSTLHVYATPEFQASTKLEPPMLAIVVATFVISLSFSCFVLYDYYARRRQAKLAVSAKSSEAIVNALFPATIRDRLLDHKNDTAARKKRVPGISRFSTVFPSMVETPAMAASDVTISSRTMSGPMSLSHRLASKPIADLFPQVTILFADIEGFTAWSSVREPSQVFVLLESIFEALDVIAKHRGVFKVETIGDCYVAVAGLPEPCVDHAVKMATFSKKAVHKVGTVVRSLDTFLGPGTAELGMRFGLHSGAVMAGVLRGEKTRFQLFGDAMNTTARIEATGMKNRVHLSQQTADLLTSAGKGEWTEPRDTLVAAKGKGELQTYWLRTLSVTGAGSIRDLEGSKPHLMRKIHHGVSSSPVGRHMSLSSSHEDESVASSARSPPPSKVDQLERLVDFNTQVLESLLKKMVAMRYSGAAGRPPLAPESLRPLLNRSKGAASTMSLGSVLDQVQKVIALPKEPTKYQQHPDAVELSPAAKTQLRDYVHTIASMYQDVPFHCFDHASHVVMSVTKLLSRVITPEKIDYCDMRYKLKAGSSALHEYTYGITSDPMTQFVIAFAALVHDVDHGGVPNVQLVKEATEIAKTYKDQSVAEQHSLHLAWDLLMERKYEDLRRCIYGSHDELGRFRALLVNTVMATDIADKSLATLRRRRWEKVFGAEDNQYLDDDTTNRKATIVIEHLIQASDVAHTMQHWHVYIRWNRRLFEECHRAFQLGRAENDPSEGWYQGEIGFFDFYIIPLAKKLKECGVFGVSSDEYLNYAMANRKEWESKGKDIVKGYLEDFRLTMELEQPESRKPLRKKQPIVAVPVAEEGATVTTELHSRSQVGPQNARVFLSSQPRTNCSPMLDPSGRNTN